MGNEETKQIVYSVATGKLDPQAGETPAFRYPGFKNRPLISTYQPNFTNLQDVLLDAVKQYQQQNHLGTREILPNGESGHYIYKTFKECFHIAKTFGSGLLSLGLVPDVEEYLNYKMKMIGVFSKNREEWYLTIWAAAYYGLTIVPLYATLGPDSIGYVLDHTHVTTLCITSDLIDEIAQFKKDEKAQSLKNIIIYGKFTAEDLGKLTEAGLQAYTMKQVMQEGAKKIYQKAKIQKDDIYTFCYTSGTTGTPKAALLSHGNILANIGSMRLTMGFKRGDSYVSYLPIPHIYESLSYWVGVTFGSKTGMYSGDVKKLKFDIQEMKPTLFPSVPRLLNKIFDGIQVKIGALTGFKKFLMKRAIKSKIKNYKKSGKTDSWKYDFLVMKKIREIFGGRIRLITSGSAPINGDTLNFIRIAFSCKVVEGYGQTENTGIATMTHVTDNIPGHVGGIVPSLELKLVDVPDMKYFSTDIDKDGKWMPRGEVCLRGPAVFKGYYKNIEKTAETIDNDGWLHTGDVGQILMNGALKIIDRKKNIFKLQQGEYIAPEKIENIYSQNTVIEEIYVYGDSLQSYLIAIIVPDQDTFLDLVGDKLNINVDTESYEEMCQNPEVVAMILEHLEGDAKKGKLFGFEKIKGLYISPISFGDNDLLTTTFKLKRNKAKLFYKEILDNLYSKD